MRSLRRGANISQAELGEALGVSFQQVQKYETGASRMGAAKLVIVARRLGVPLCALFEGVAPWGDSPAAEDAERALAAHFRRLAPDLRARLLAFIQGLASDADAGGSAGC